MTAGWLGRLDRLYFRRRGWIARLAPGRPLGGGFGALESLKPCSEITGESGKGGRKKPELGCPWAVVPEVIPGLEHAKLYALAES